MSFIGPGVLPPARLPVASDGITYNMAQELAWVDSDHFAVGRWDGSLSIFRFTGSSQAGSIITTSVSNPSSEGVQMIVWLAPRTFVSNAQDASLAIWRSPSGDWTKLGSPTILPYDAALGTANSGDAFTFGVNLYLVVGHANGFLSIWVGRADGSGLSITRVVDLRSLRPVNPWNLQNIRDVSLVSSQSSHCVVVTGSENGELCIVRLPDGAILSRTLFNPAAQRGINSVAVSGRELLVANCSVGEDDRNLWYFALGLENWTVELRDAVNLKINASAPQVFNFCTIWAGYDNGRCFFSSTEEGALWMGTVQDGRRLVLLGYQKLASSIGSALGWNRSGQLAVVNHNLYEFRTLSTASTAGAVSDLANPGRLP